MKKTLFVVVLIAVGSLAAALMTACAVPEVEPTPSPEPDPDEPVSSDDTPVPTEPTEEEPGEYETGEANVEQIAIMILESFPVQVQVTASGNLPDGCTEIDEVNVTQNEQTFDVTITTRRPVDQMCTEALVPFEETFPLDVEGLEAGTYIVNVNGVTKTFELAVDNVSPTEEAAGEPGEDEYVYQMAEVEDVEVQDGQAGSENPEVIIQGYLSDACTELHNISDELSDSTILVSVESRRLAGAVCAQVIEEFEAVYTLTSVPGPGTYTLNVNGVEQEFTVN